MGMEIMCEWKWPVQHVWVSNTFTTETACWSWRPTRRWRHRSKVGCT